MSPSVTNPAKKPTLLTPDLAVENAETSAEKPTESSVVKQKIGNVENTENTENTGSEEHESQKSQENENDKNDDKNEDDKKNNLNCSLLWKYVPIAYMYPCCCVDTVSIWILRFGWVYFCIGFYILYWRDNSGLPPWSMFPLVEVSMLGFAVPGFVLIHGLNLVKKDRARVLGEERQARLDAERAKRGTKKHEGEGAGGCDGGYGSGHDAAASYIAAYDYGAGNADYGNADNCGTDGNDRMV